MLSILGYATIAVILVLLLTQRTSAVVALAGVPILAAFVAGNSATQVGVLIKDGLGGVVGVAAMFVFAIMFFGVLRDAGFFDPVINRIVKFAGHAPVTVTIATTALAMVAHLDGAGAITFLIAVPAMLPIYERLGMSRLVLTTCVGLGAGVMNIVPWGGPTARAATTIGVDANEIWIPLIPAQIGGMILALGVAYFLGRKEARRLQRLAAGDVTAEVEESTARVRVTEGVSLAENRGKLGTGTAESERLGTSVVFLETSSDPEIESVGDSLRRPKLLWVNAILMVATLVALISAIAPPEMCFMIAAIVALLINYPGLKAQTGRFDAHAKGAMLMASTLLAAGVLLGVLKGSGMIEAMAHSAADIIPSQIMPVLPLLVGVLGVPMSLIFGPDAYYFGVLPVLVGVGEQFGVSAMHLAQASVIGQETVGFPISPLTGAFYLLVGLANVDIGRHIRHLIGWAWLVSIGMLAIAVATGVIPLVAS